MNHRTNPGPEDRELAPFRLLKKLTVISPCGSTKLLSSDPNLTLSSAAAIPGSELLMKSWRTVSTMGIVSRSG